ncbi:hypothetical protein FPV67DRAFT_1667242 [Lyophyllum atratum]|nr:hypothetical protein FPV67DRAFT_1667242 [Lyophyllum atratum]
MSTFPHELILLVLEELKGFHTDLRSCALVCRDWRVPCQVPLFQSVVLDSDIKCVGLHDLLVASPRIAPLIHDLSIVTDDVPEVILDEQASLTAALLLLTDLESLTMRLGWRMVWHTLSVDLRDSIIAVLKLPSLVSLRMENWFFDFADIDLHNIFRHGTALKRLSMTMPSCPSSWRPSEDAFLQEVPKRARLDELTVGLEYGNFGIGEWFCRSRCSLDLTGLRSLHIMHTGDSSLVSRLLGVAGQSLERFHLEVEEFWPSESPPGVDISRNVALRSLTLDFSYDSLSPKDCPPPWLELTLATVHPAARIKELILKLSVHVSEDHDDTEEHEEEDSDIAIRKWDYSGWSRFAMSLTTPDLSALEMIKVTVAFHSVNAALFKEIALRELQHLGPKLLFEVIETL